MSSYGVSDRGPVRQINEDCFLVDDNLSLYVVADGMGGHVAGELASRLSVETIINFIRRSDSPEDISWPCGVDAALSFDGNRLRTAIYLANRRVFRESEANGDYTGMGSTVVCALIHDGQLTIGHVGDSRLYTLADGVFAAKTRDDTWAATVLADGQGNVDPAALAAHPMRHVLTNVIGGREQVDIHISCCRINDGHTVLLCSDGVHSVLTDDRLAAILSSPGTADVVAQAVVTAALENGTTDNVTALVIRHEPGAAHGQ
jgi:protein phosphatase